MTAPILGDNSIQKGSGEATSEHELMTPGAKVKLHSLKFQQLNGLEGELVEFIAESGRWRCKVIDGNEQSMKDLKPENLSVITSAASSDSYQSTAEEKHAEPPWEGFFEKILHSMTHSHSAAGHHVGHAANAAHTTAKHVGHVANAAHSTAKHVGAAAGEKIGHVANAAHANAAHAAQTVRVAGGVGGALGRAHSAVTHHPPQIPGIHHAGHAGQQIHHHAAAAQHAGQQIHHHAAAAGGIHHQAGQHLATVGGVLGSAAPAAISVAQTAWPVLPVLWKDLQEGRPVREEKESWVDALKSEWFCITGDKDALGEKMLGRRGLNKAISESIEGMGNSMNDVFGGLGALLCTKGPLGMEVYAESDAFPGEDAEVLTQDGQSKDQFAQRAGIRCIEKKYGGFVLFQDKVYLRNRKPEELRRNRAKASFWARDSVLYILPEDGRFF